MRVVQAERFGGPEVLVTRQVPDLMPSVGQVLIDVAAADVMFLDTQIRSGWGQEFFSVRPPYVPGAGVAGTVVSVGAGEDKHWLGQAVVASTGERGPDGRALAPTGGYAQQAVVPVDALVAIPDGVSVQDAAALLHDGQTSLQLLDTAGARPGERVLVMAAAGGAGSLLVQLLSAAGARVIGAARGTQKLALVRELGAESVVDYAESDWTEQARDATEGIGVDVVLDGAGGALGRAAFDLTAPGGRFITYGASSGEFAAVNPRLAQQHTVRVTGLFDLRQLMQADRNELTRRTLAEASAGRLEPVIGQTFDLDHAADAHAAIAARTVIGKTLLTI